MRRTTDRESPHRDGYQLLSTSTQVRNGQDPVLLVMLGAWLLLLPTVGWADSLGRRAAGAQYLNAGQGMGMAMGYEGNVRGKVMMGEQNKDCDDAKTKLEVDWADQVPPLLCNVMQYC